MKTLKDMDFKDKKVIVRVDFNVPISDGNVLNDARIKAALPTIKYILDKGGKIVLMSHLGRPKGKVVEELRMKPVGDKLAELLDKEVDVKRDCIDVNFEKYITLLENLRFYPEEEKDDEEFASKLAKGMDIYVNDAFGVCHRANASVHAITKLLPSCAGVLVEKEIKMLSKLNDAKKPFVAVLGGAKVSDKIGVIKVLLEKVDRLLIGGAMMFTFLKAHGLEVGKSLVEEDKIELAKELLDDEKIILPMDCITEDGVSLVYEIPKDKTGLDIGPDSVKLFRTILREAKTVFWNGPMGKFEDPKYRKGTDSIAEFVSSVDMSVVGGGETVSAIEDLKFSHVSTGGGAALDFIEGKELPGIKALEDVKNH